MKLFSSLPGFFFNNVFLFLSDNHYKKKCIITLTNFPNNIIYVLNYKCYIYVVKKGKLKLDSFSLYIVKYEVDSIFL